MSRVESSESLEPLRSHFEWSKTNRNNNTDVEANADAQMRIVVVAALLDGPRELKRYSPSS